MKKYRHVLDRRTLLRGAGSIAIGLPLLEPMYTKSVWGQGDAPPQRVITFFFGLGVRPEHAAQGLTGPLAPLSPFADKIGYSRNLDLGTSDDARNHDTGSAHVFRGVGNEGATIDQFVLDTLHGVQTPTPIRTLVAGTYKRNGRSREHHSRLASGGISQPPYRSPQELFDRVFGSASGSASGSSPESVSPSMTCAERSEDARKAHLERSILDTVKSQYESFALGTGNLGKAARGQMADHFDKIRELELKVFGAEMMQATGAVQAAMTSAATSASTSCMLPERPPSFSERGNFNKLINSPDNGGTRETEPYLLNWNDWDQLWRAMVDVYVMGLACDVFRFGNLQFTSGGERISLSGDYEWGGDRITFNDPTTSHEYWHGWGSDDRIEGYASREWVGHHTHVLMSRAAYFMQRVDAIREPNGKTMLENMLFMMGSELGNGGSSHSLKDVFHLWTGANNSLRVGAGVDFQDMDAGRFYSTATEALVGKAMSDKFEHAPTAQSRGLLIR